MNIKTWHKIGILGGCLILGNLQGYVCSDPGPTGTTPETSASQGKVIVFPLDIKFEMSMMV